MSSNKPWWYKFAQLGQAAGARLKVFAGVAQVVPVPAIQVVGEVLAAAEPAITAEAKKGVAESGSNSARPQERGSPKRKSMNGRSSSRRARARLRLSRCFGTPTPAAWT